MYLKKSILNNQLSYKILYLRGKSKVDNVKPGNIIPGRWDTLGASDSFKLEIINGIDVQIL